MFAGASLDENSGAFCELKANFFRLILTKAELLALTYNDINLEEKTISINKSYQRLKGKDMITQPKTPKSIRVITMPDFLAEEFREYCSHLYGIMKKERLFRFTKSHMEHCMATGIERSGVKRIRLHDLRHSHARNRRVFLPTGIKRWTESEKYGKISIRNDIVKSLRKESKVVQTKKQYGDFSLTALSFASISIFSG